MLSRFKSQSHEYVEEKGVMNLTKAMVCEKDRTEKAEGCLKNDVPRCVFPEEHKEVKRLIMNPRGVAARRWSRVFSSAIMVSLFIDPLFFFSPRVDLDLLCVRSEVSLDKIFIILRTLNDVFYWVHVIIQFRMAYVAPSSRVFGRGELIIDPCKIMLRYLKRGFWLDLLAAFPLPQVLVLRVVPNAGGVKIGWRFIIFFQYLYRLYRIYPLSLRTLNATGVMTETAWLRAAYDLLLFYVASHVSGACWYLFTIQRQVACWESVCSGETQSCGHKFFDCSMANDPSRSAWLTTSNVTTTCNPSNGDYQFGIYALGVQVGATSSSLAYKYTYALWIGLQAICSTGQTLMTSIYVSENIYSVVVGSLGLLLMAMLIAHMQRYLQSITARLEEWRLKEKDSEEWMNHRQLPADLKRHVHKYDRLMWLATRGVDEEALLNGFPADLQREIKRHLCLGLVQQVPLFDQLDALTLDAICERLRPAFSTKGTFLVREGDPVKEIFFVIQGYLDSYTTNGGRNGFFNSSRIGQGGFCGEELLTWALDPHPSHDSLPSSTRTIKAISDIETFCLAAEDLKFVVLQFRRLHSRELIHKFRFYSLQWRTWSACYIQAAWRRFKHHKELVRLRALECHSEANLSVAEDDEMDIFVPRPNAGIEVYAARLIANMRRENNRYC
ncbi:hypothetical protein Nepgr_000650 [Nepenthes gracilis]|uniref:Cyclic nucleotide-binding domain-containing protein n=1 Tax=Nepenthes gracilis TaxID=150966 RepID=A0AAD3P3B3_NEPGR|nr:hypothetical protein Nepgr_000650 [Nepenthes gracilis]